MDQASSEIVTYYQERYEESTRLERRPHARLERIRTLELLRALLPAAPAKVLDVGGGPGAYARELLADGHQVRLVDLVPSHVAQARACEPPIDAVVGDARDLPEPDASQDVTLVLGPLYHLHERADRVRALREAIRVTRPGGPIAAAAITRFAGPIDLMATARFDERALRDAERLITTGVNDTSIGFTHAYFHRVSELRAECQEAGLADLVIHGVEGPGWAAAEAGQFGPHAETIFEGALRLARLYSTEPDLVPASSHLLAIGTAPRR